MAMQIKLFVVVVVVVVVVSIVSLKLISSNSATCSSVNNGGF